MAACLPCRAALAAIALTAAACVPAEPPPPPPTEPSFELRALSFGALEGWQDDDPTDAIAAFRRSCAPLAGRDDSRRFGPTPAWGTVGDWRPACEAAEGWTTPTAADARAFFEDWFQPYRVSDGGEREGLFTGYYEPLLHGSRRPEAPYTVPLYRAPDDLLRVDLGRFDPELEGYWIAGRVEGGQFVPYYSREEIAGGALEGKGLELLWVDDPVDKFFLQIQGSGQVRLADGSLVRVGYASQNGHPYRAIGRDLIASGALERDHVSLQTIRSWLETHPEYADGMMARNRSYVFFEERPELAFEDGPLGAQGVPLTPERSLAVDRRHIAYGAPVWLETTAPWPEGEAPLRRLMIAQDTGGAITGVVRGDVFWGSGSRAEAVAGRMKSRGSYVVLLPSALVPTS